MTLGVLEALCKKSLRIISYRNCKNFSNNVFNKHLKLNLKKFNSFEFSLKDFQDSCLSVLNCLTLLNKNMQEPTKLHL